MFRLIRQQHRQRPQLLLPRPYSHRCVWRTPTWYGIRTLPCELGFAANLHNEVAKHLSLLYVWPDAKGGPSFVEREQNS